MACVEGEWILAPEQAPATVAPPAKPPANAKAPPNGMAPPPPPPEGNLGFLNYHLTSFKHLLGQTFVTPTNGERETLEKRCLSNNLYNLII